MYFLFTATDKPDSAALRQQIRPLHRQHIHGDHDYARLVYGAPLADENGQMGGTFLLIEAESIAAAQRFLDEDPYIKAGLFAEEKLTPLHEAAPDPIFKAAE